MKRFVCILFVVFASLACRAGVCDSTRLFRPNITPTIAAPQVRINEGMIRMVYTPNVRMYCNLTLPTITSACLVDVGTALSQMGGLLGSCPRWFTMFDPKACPTDELFGTANCETAIMLTMRTYF